ncbi:MAG: M23 family peptidase, partial [Wolbachia endosymbiont of Andrena agilissima]|nr:M23 family peptidase [Wolbachia endosymbiont of Andrena agilissima]
MKLIIFILLYILPIFNIHALKTPDNSKETFLISSTIKSSFFATGIEQGLAPNTVVKLINIYKDFGVDFK